LIFWPKNFDQKLISISLISIKINWVWNILWHQKILTDGFFFWFGLEKIFYLQKFDQEETALKSATILWDRSNFLWHHGSQILVNFLARIKKVWESLDAENSRTFFSHLFSINKKFQLFCKRSSQAVSFYF
jgi:hypothetical protein